MYLQRLLCCLYTSRKINTSLQLHILGEVLLRNFTFFEAMRAIKHTFTLRLI